MGYGRKIKKVLTHISGCTQNVSSRLSLILSPARPRRRLGSIRRLKQVYSTLSILSRYITLFLLYGISGATASPAPVRARRLSRSLLIPAAAIERR
jgi:hypothetical protein